MEPMLATPTAAAGALPDGPGWLFEVKWDGVRILADTTRGDLRLLGRQGRDAALAYPELASLSVLPRVVLDGEVVVLRGGVPSFSALAERMHVRDRVRAASLARRVPVSYLVFDVLMLDGVDLTRRSFEERRARLESLELPEPARLSPVYQDGRVLWEATRVYGLEGVVAKRRTSTYQQGRRSTDWVKSVHRRTRTAVVGGWRPESTGSGRLGALVLGAPDAAGALHYLCRAGSGLTGALARDLTRMLAPLGRATSPFAEPLPPLDARGTVWVEPEVVVEVRYLTRTPTGRLRQPVIRGMRDDTGVDPWEAR